MINMYDCKNRLVCRGDPQTGYIETKYQKQTTRTTLPLKTSLIIEREHVWTKITRVSNTQFRVDSKII